MFRTFCALVVLGLAALVAADPHEGHGNETQKEWTGKAWLGKWVSTDRSENWDAFVQALGYPLAQYGSNHKTIHKIWKEGDHYHHQIRVKDNAYKQDIEFKLNEEGKTLYNGTEVSFKYTEDGDNLHNEVKIPSKNKVISDTYTVKGGDLEKTYKVNDVIAKRWYKKQAHQAYTDASA